MTKSENTPIGNKSDSNEAAGAVTRPNQIQSSDLFADRQEVEILHAGETYRLRKTRTGKLILTK
ncbi:MAG: hemin uptake protein HemP [Planctomycetaceae bacterium]|nr:hemin uptake protein HemP [Planctomycetaceae bacterium]